MSKTKGSKNYFQGDKLYILKDVLDYIRKNEPSLEIPQSWEHGGGLNDLAKKFGIVPDYDNGIEGRGHFAKYKGTTLYKFAALVVDYLKSVTPKKPRLTPIEVITKMAQKDIEKAADEVLDDNSLFDPSPMVIKSGSVPAHPEEEPENELRIPKGFVVLTKSKYHDAVAFRVDDILQIEEFFGEDIKIVTKIFPDIRVEETFEEVIEAINKALEV